MVNSNATPKSVHVYAIGPFLNASLGLYIKIIMPSAQTLASTPDSMFSS